MKLFKHIFFWFGTLIFLTLLFGFNYGEYLQAFYFVTLLLPVAMGASYFYSEYLIPRYLLKKKFFSFGLYSFYTFIISIYLELWVIIGALILLANYNYREMNPLMNNVLVLAMTLYLIVFLSALSRLLKELFNQESQMHQLEQEKQILKKEKQSLKQAFITIRADRKNHPIPLKDIQYIESLSDYIKIHTSTKQWTTKEKISQMETKLPEYFVRIHRSFIVNTNQVENFNKEFVVVLGKELPISRKYKSALKILG